MNVAPKIFAEFTIGRHFCVENVCNFAYEIRDVARAHTNKKITQRP